MKVEFYAVYHFKASMVGNARVLLLDPGKSVQIYDITSLVISFQVDLSRTRASQERFLQEIGFDI